MCIIVIINLIIFSFIGRDCKEVNSFSKCNNPHTFHNRSKDFTATILLLDRGE